MIALLCVSGALNTQTSLSAIPRNGEGFQWTAVSGVEVAIHDLDDESDPVVSSASDGSFALRQITPGRYEVSAAHDGFGHLRVNFDVAAGEDHAVDLTLIAAVTPPVTNVAPGGFWKRFIQAYKDDWYPVPVRHRPPQPRRGTGIQRLSSGGFKPSFSVLGLANRRHGMAGI